MFKGRNAWERVVVRFRVCGATTLLVMVGIFGVEKILRYVYEGGCSKQREQDTSSSGGDHWFDGNISCC